MYTYVKNVATISLTGEEFVEDEDFLPDPDCYITFVQPPPASALANLTK